jgi:hypothetical protein
MDVVVRNQLIGTIKTIGYLLRIASGSLSTIDVVAPLDNLLKLQSAVFSNMHIRACVPSCISSHRTIKSTRLHWLAGNGKV